MAHWAISCSAHAACAVDAASMVRHERKRAWLCCRAKCQRDIKAGLGWDPSQEGRMPDASDHGGGGRIPEGAISGGDPPRL